MQINPQKLTQMAQEWDPTPFLEALNAPGAGGAMDMSGSAASPLGQQPQSGMDYASIFGQAQAPGMAPISPGNMAGLMQMSQPKPSQVKAPAPVMPKQGPAPRSPAMPQIGQVPTIADFLRRK